MGRNCDGSERRSLLVKAHHFIVQASHLAMKEKHLDPQVDHLEAATEDLQMKTELSTHSETFVQLRAQRFARSERFRFRRERSEDLPPLFRILQHAFP